MRGNQFVVLDKLQRNGDSDTSIRIHALRVSRNVRKHGRLVYLEVSPMSVTFDVWVRADMDILQFTSLLANF